MDNHLTPNKIQRLIHLAEDKSFNRRLLLHDEELKSLTQATVDRSGTNYESSSGILDLERVEGFGESGIGNISNMSKSAVFNPGEMTGRSTGTEDISSAKADQTRTFGEYIPPIRHSLDNIMKNMDLQTLEINNIMRHSIASNFSVHSKRDLTADEASFVIKEAPLPVPQSTQMNFPDSILMANETDMSMGAYFQKRCLTFDKMLGKCDSPDKSMAPSITEVSSNAPLSLTEKPLNETYNNNQTLDSVPVRQPRQADTGNKENINYFVPINQPVKHSMKPSEISKVLEPSKAQLNASVVSHKAFMHSNKPTDLLLKKLHSSMALVTEDTDGSVDSMSVSKIADYLGKQSIMSVSDILNAHKKQKPTKQYPELNMNTQNRNEVQVTYLKDSRNTDTASSSGTVNTVVSLKQLKNEQLPEVVVTRDSLMNVENPETDDMKNKQRVNSKTPSSKSQSTLSTVQENCASFKSNESSMHSSKGDNDMSHMPSPNVEYKELDNSVDWRDVLQQKRFRQECLAKDQWVDIKTTPVNGFVGISCPVTITVTTLIDSWLTAKFQLDNLPDNSNDLTIELPRFPLLLSPGKTEKITLHLTSNVELNTNISYTMFLKDASIDSDLEQKGNLEIAFKMPVIQAMSSSGMNRVNFPPAPEKSCSTKYVVLLSDCPVDLQLELSVGEGCSMFGIRNVQEVRKCEVTKVLTDRHGIVDEGKAKIKGLSKQLCRLSSGNAISILMTFNAPVLSELGSDNLMSLNGSLNVNMIGTNTLLRKVDLTGVVGFIKLVVGTADNEQCQVQLTHQPSTITVHNTGSLPGTWSAKYASAQDGVFPFKISPAKLDVQPGGSKVITLVYTGQDDVCERTIAFEESSTGVKTPLELIGCTDKPKAFPIKTNHNALSWVRAGRKEISFKNSSNKKVHIRCHIVGEGFSIDLPGVESRGICMPFAPNECRTVAVIFNPNSGLPHAATFHLVYDKNSEFSRKVRLFGCATAESVRWSGLVTCGDTALVRAVPRLPIELKLYNKSSMPAFIYARVHFNLQYISVASSSRLTNANCVIPPRSKHSLLLHVNWALIERRARNGASGAALASVTVLAGSQLTRKRILRILRDESTGQIDTCLLPEHLRVLAGQFEGDDPTLDSTLNEFEETKASLDELIGGLQELTAQIDPPQDFAEENTIIITDETVIEHHTLCD